ncbi:MAG: tyrosine-type recombinase/integrase [Hamadaea sp.]|uniref:site-specific integrase n=1 Tax=Hamadaea sp. TaxID=2024425 RepID=UPI001857FE98|nr:site-specific integrase [Hamadaea sp.]NUT21251.1 tyrosine-type recombinase/integrase [Hamadaea sp.]
MDDELAIIGGSEPVRSAGARDRIVDDGAEQTVMAGLAENTRRAYERAWSDFATWCGQNDRNPLPASEETLVSYLHHLTVNTDCAPSSAGVAMAAIRRAHRMHRPPVPWAESEYVTAALRGLKNVRIEQGYRPRRAAAARTDVVRQLADTCDLGTPTGVRDRAILLLGYRFAARRSELGVLRIGDLTFTSQGLEVYLAKSKTDQDGHGAVTVIPYSANPEYCTVRAAKAWVDLLAAEGVKEGALFRPVRYGKVQQKGIGTAYRMSGTAVEQIFKRAVELADIDPAELNGKLVPHSLRRGWATDARAAGGDIVEIARGGRWSKRSAVVLDYMDDVDRWRSTPNAKIDL